LPSGVCCVTNSFEKRKHRLNYSERVHLARRLIAPNHAGAYPPRLPAAIRNVTFLFTPTLSKKPSARPDLVLTMRSLKGL
jgi:hypothetical protein